MENPITPVGAGRKGSLFDIVVILLIVTTVAYSFAQIVKYDPN